MKQEDVPCWFGLGSLYGSETLVRAARRVVKECLAPIDRRVRFVNRRTVDMGQRVLKFVPSTVRSKLRRTLQQTRAHLDVLEGKPSEVALPLSYWRSEVSKPTSNLDPARDGCGLLWYAPLVPMKEEIVRNTVDMIRRVCLEYKIELLMTLTALSSRCFDLTLPILLAQKDAGQADGARRCFEQLFAEGKQLGVAPYRVGVEAMPLLVQSSSYWRLVSALKAAIDPEQIMAPGRYAL